MSTANAEDIHRQVRIYKGVFFTLMALTVITVGISYLHVAVPLAITVALIIAIIKGSLVANFFMHLSHERLIIYASLLLTVAFFVVLMFLPVFTQSDSIHQRLPWQPAATAEAEGHH
jgi:cytochrome c oxidase subunit 4